MNGKNRVPLPRIPMCSSFAAEEASSSVVLTMMTSQKYICQEPALRIIFSCKLLKMIHCRRKNNHAEPLLETPPPSSKPLCKQLKLLEQPRHRTRSTTLWHSNLQLSSVVQNDLGFRSVLHDPWCSFSSFDKNSSS